MSLVRAFIRSTVCVTRQPGQQRSRGISVLAGERALLQKS
ncbi:hypothetical protein CSC36_6632 [Pseudomonas aeruginosa]|nr:hypothetical protein CSC36_6632 [Pseudomonas aeruginosa]